MNASLVSDESEGLRAFLSHQRQAALNAVYGLGEDQARLTPSPSSLSLGGLIKHLAYGEQNWTDRIEGIEPPAMDESYGIYMDSFVLGAGETLAGAVDAYRAAAARTDAVVMATADLGREVPLPDAPWYPGTTGCSVRWVLLHLIEETARHVGHLDIIREALDGAQSGSLMAAAEGWPADGWVQPWAPGRP